MISSDSRVGGVGAQHNRCCLISKIIERQGSVPWQRSPYELLTLEECQGRIRSAKVHCALWNSTLKQHQGKRWEGGVFSGAQVEISGTAQPGFFGFLCFNSLLYHRNVSRNVTPLSPDCSLIILSNEKRRRRGGEREGKMHANCNSFMQPAAYRVYNHKPEKNPYSTIKLIVSSPFFPLTGCISTSLHITS